MSRNSGNNLDDQEMILVFCEITNSIWIWCILEKSKNYLLKLNAQLSSQESFNYKFELFYC